MGIEHPVYTTISMFLIFIWAIIKLESPVSKFRSRRIQKSRLPILKFNTTHWQLQFRNYNQTVKVAFCYTDIEVADLKACCRVLNGILTPAVPSISCAQSATCNTSSVALRGHDAWRQFKKFETHRRSNHWNDPRRWCASTSRECEQLPPCAVSMFSPSSAHWAHYSSWLLLQQSPAEEHLVRSSSALQTARYVKLWPSLMIQSDMTRVNIAFLHNTSHCRSVPRHLLELYDINIRCSRRTDR